MAEEIQMACSRRDQTLEIIEEAVTNLEVKISDRIMEVKVSEIDQADKATVEVVNRKTKIGCQTTKQTIHIQAVKAMAEATTLTVKVPPTEQVQIIQDANMT